MVEKILFFIYFAAAVLSAGEVDVISVNSVKTGKGTYTFHVTLKHDDRGWKHYANRWEILDPDGKIIATRTLYHPHVSEQPFTRSLSNVKIPKGVKMIIIRGHDLVHGFGGKSIKVRLE